jgi:hypothetical protein
MAEESWRGLEVRGLRDPRKSPGQPLDLQIRDDAFVGEVGLMGHGLQMWLQTIWFLTRSEPGGVVVLDEPDVYLHPDLQHRILARVRGVFDQLIIATHSVEIISDVDPGSVLAIDKEAPRSAFVTAPPGVQDIIDRLGSGYSIEVTRLVRSTRALIVEGDDARILGILQEKLGESEFPIPIVPTFELGGRGGWAMMPALPRKNRDGKTIKTYAVLDRDCFPDEEVTERYAEAQQRRVNLHVWSKRELENYLLIPTAIQRVIADGMSGGIAPTTDEVAAHIDQIVEGMQDAILAGIVNTIHQREKKLGAGAASVRGQEVLASKARTRDDAWAIASGKVVIGQVVEWSKQRFGVTFGPELLARHLTSDEVPDEIRAVLEGFEGGATLSTPTKSWAASERKPLPKP